MSVAPSRLRPTSSLHVTVREEILKRISNGTYQPDAPIPSTAMLGEEFGVSLITIKRALRDLQAAGMIVSVAGKGTYVKKQTRILRKLDMTAPSFEGTTMQLLSVTREKIADPVMLTFSPPRAAMLCVRKTIFIDDMPFLYDSTYLSADVADEIVDEFSERLVTEALRRHNILVTNTDLIIDAAPATGQVEDVFGIPTGYPILRRFYKFSTDTADISIYGVLQAPFDRLSCSVSFPARNGRASRPGSTSIASSKHRA
ncbi:GntR family transcriptional regulator [Bradyrhizobium neotropicale]|uniref:GntR family transcriptional regulator n=1 Tax=Bradyrhizobium neotropicale TaxID=1497615 RepID=A0A176ZF20_9BRAD|nr:GntR family transcriptional regulator [Bradyrhizobium neotropicale]OAF18794.1 GntR family transcriptional regulator [Bradyrhizobium neotropicale]